MCEGRGKFYWADLLANISSTVPRGENTASRDPMGPPRLCPSHRSSPHSGWSASTGLAGAGPSCWGLNLNDWVAVSASQWGKCSHFQSKSGSEPGPRHPLPLQAGPPLLLSLYAFALSSLPVCCCSDVASCVCVGFATSLSSLLSAENIPPPLCSE